MLTLRFSIDSNVITNHQFKGYKNFIKYSQKFLFCQKNPLIFLLQFYQLPLQITSLFVLFHAFSQ